MGRLPPHRPRPGGGRDGQEERLVVVGIPFAGLADLYVLSRDGKLFQGGGRHGNSEGDTGSRGTRVEVRNDGSGGPDGVGTPTHEEDGSGKTRLTLGGDGKRSGLRDITGALPGDEGRCGRRGQRRGNEGAGLLAHKGEDEGG